MSVLRFFSTALISSTFLLSPARASSFPRGCEAAGFGYNKHYLVLNDTGNQSFYLIQNRTNKKIELQRIETRDIFMSPPLLAKLDPQQWSAFASDVKYFYFQCLVRQADDVLPIPCEEALDVCQYPRVKFALSNMGNYWVSVNKPQTRVITDATSRGIYLKW